MQNVLDEVYNTGAQENFEMVEAVCLLSCTCELSDRTNCRRRRMQSLPVPERAILKAVDWQIRTSVRILRRQFLIDVDTMSRGFTGAQMPG